MKAMLYFMQKMLTRARPTPPPEPPPKAPPGFDEGRVWRVEVPDKAQMRHGLWVSSVGFHTNQRPHRIIQRNVLNSHAMVYISRGQGYFESAATGRRTIGAGTVLWLFPGVAHSYSPTQAWDEHWIVFGGTLARELQQQEMLSPQRPIVNVGADADVTGLISRLEEVFLRGGPLSATLAASLTYQFIVIVHGIAAGLTQRDRSLDPAVAKTLRIIEQEAGLGLSPRSLARRVHTGYSTLRRRFKRQTGFSIKEYILRLQLRHARELLSGTSRSIADVAQEVGIENPLYFSRLFREREGLSPSEYRRKR